MSHLAIYAVELGGERCTAGYYLDGKTTQVASAPTPQTKCDGADALRSTISKLVAEVSEVAPPMKALAVSFSSFLDLRKKPGARKYGTLRDYEVVISAAHINGIVNLPFFQWLEEAGFGVPLHVENDVNSAIRAIEVRDAVSVNLGTGLAAAIKRDNRIVHMPHTWSCYQIGHGFRWNLPDEMIRKCGCGSVGCLEAAIGAWALTERFGVAPQDADPAVYEQMASEVVEMLAPAVTDLVEKSGIDNVILTGGAARGFDTQAGLSKRLAEAVESMRPNRPPARVSIPEIGLNPGLHGVALAALDCEVLATPIGL